MSANDRTRAVLASVTVGFLGLAALFALDVFARPNLSPTIPLVDPMFTNTSTVRMSGAEVVRTGGDASGQNCYACHDAKKPVALQFGADGKIVLPKEHDDISLAHGRHNRNNNCYNCHNESNLELLQTRDGRELKLLDSTPLCGSCHGPTYRDWDAGVHGRTGGYWKRDAGEIRRENCVACHDPHAPKFPPQKPAPGPHALRPAPHAAPSPVAEH